MMRLWMVRASVDDDPYQGTGTAIVFAPTKREAKKVGKEAILDAYWRNAGGWGTSRAKIVTDYPIEVETVPTPEQANIVMAVCHSDR